MTNKVISGDREITVEAVTERGLRAASAMESIGVGPGDGVAIFLRNDFPFFEASIAAGQLGAYPVPVNWHYNDDEAGYIFRDCGARIIVIHADLLPQVEAGFPEGVPVKVVPTPPEIQRAYQIDPALCEVPDGYDDWSDWIEGFDPRPPITTEPPGTMIYTSGTTGRPKGVRRAPPSAEQAAAQLNMLTTVFGMDMEKGHEMVVAVTGPMYHSAPNAYGASALRMGATVVLQPRFDPEELLALIEKHKVTHMHMVPTMFVRLLKLPEDVRRKYDISSLKFTVHAAAPCPPDIKKRMIEWWGPVVNEYYGATETGAVVFCDSDQWMSHPGTVGKALPNARILILDDDGNEVPQGQSGEIFCRLVDTTDFTYHGADEKRKEAEKKGLISVGDVGYFDEDGFLYLNDRKRDMVISGGVNIYPIEIENALHTMPGIHDCAVFGIPDDEYGESLCAVVQPEPGGDVTEQDVKDFLRRKVAGYMVPRVVEFQSELPREDSGKIFKRKLREPYWEKAGRRI